MEIDKKQLEINVNLFALKPGFLNLELHYVIAKDVNTFRFVQWNDRPAPDEQKFFSFLTDQPLHIPAGDIHLQQSYVLTDTPAYDCVTSPDDFKLSIEKVKKDGVGKSIRCFGENDIDYLFDELSKAYGPIQKHLVTSSQGQHLLLVFDDIEVSISATMVYFRHKTPVNDSHYRHVEEEQKGL